jgi:3-dehydroquinate synthetase
VVGEGILSDLGPRVLRAMDRTAKAAGKAFIVLDSGVPATLVRRVQRSLRTSGFALEGCLFTPTEADKSIPTLHQVLEAMTAARIERRDVLVALGGGITGDLAGFAASAYRRGIPVVQCPTTLLAMVDASVGGKTGVNLGTGGSLMKNMVGAFHQPRLVVADVAALASLEPREFRCGLAECIKHGMIAGGLDDAGLFDATLRTLSAKPDRAALARLIARNVALKARVVAGDEREEAPVSKGGRALLNLGHTFGHAIESLKSLRVQGMRRPGPIMHGEAVGLGLIAASVTSFVLGLCDNMLPARVEAAVHAAGLPIRVWGLPDSPEMIRLMGHDKKVAGGVLRLVLPVGDKPGKAKVVENPPLSAVTLAIDAIRGEGG